MGEMGRGSVSPGVPETSETTELGWGESWSTLQRHAVSMWEALISPTLRLDKNKSKPQSHINQMRTHDKLQINTLREAQESSALRLETRFGALAFKGRNLYLQSGDNSF